MRVILKEAELEFDDKMCNVTTFHETRPEEIYKLSYNIQLYVELKTFFVKVGISLPNSNGNLISIQNTVSDVCKYFMNNNNNLLLKIFFNGNFGKKNFPTTCPVKSGMYSIEDFRINDNLLKIRSGEAKFLVAVDFCTKISENAKLHCFIQMKFYGEVKDQMKWQQEVEKMRKNKQ